METEQKSVDYQAVLADLEAKRDELEHAITAIKRMVGEPVTPSLAGQHKQPTSHALTPQSFFGMSVGEAAKKYLSFVKEAKSVPVIARALQEHGIKTVSKNFSVIVFSSLERLEEAGELVRPQRGLWGLKEWYPGLRVSKKNGDKKDTPESAKKTGAQQKSAEVKIKSPPPVPTPKK